MSIRSDRIDGIFGHYVGRQSGCQDRLFYYFNLEDQIPAAQPPTRYAALIDFSILAICVGISLRSTATQAVPQLIPSY